MQLLLTSGGITNEKIADALRELIDKPIHETSLVFVPTAANVEEGDKGWLIDDLFNLKKLQFKKIDIVDISAVPKEIWLPRLEAADVFVFGGGNPYHLMEWIQKSGLGDLLPDLLKTRVYVGISAGSMVVSAKILSHAMQIYHEEKGQLRDMKGLGFVDFMFKAHLNSPSFPKMRKESLRQLATVIPEAMYALDDQAALKIIDEDIEVVGGGQHLTFNL
jgi:dipeptidase E